MIRTKHKAPVKRPGRHPEVLMANALEAFSMRVPNIAKKQPRDTIVAKAGIELGLFLDADAALKRTKEQKKRVGRPPSGKIIVTLRLDPDVVAKFKADGPGWQARMNDALAATIV